MVPAAGHGLLAGLRILEVGHFVAVPFCTWLLGDLGAHVIKIEPPIGAHTVEVMRELLGLQPAEIAALRQEGVI